MKAPSLLVKITLANLLAVAAVMALVSTMVYRSLNEHFQAENRTSQERSLRWFQKHFEDLWPLTTEAVNRQCRELAKEGPMRMTVVAADGQVLGDSEKDPATMKNHRGPDRPEILHALEGQLGENSRLSESVGVMFRYLALPIRDGKDGRKTVAVVRTAIPVRSITDESAFISTVVWWSSLVAVFATAILALLLGWWWYAPLRQVAQTARRIASGNLAVRARPTWTAELADLAAALNEMRESLSQQIDLIETQREDLRTVIANTREGILATDARGTIVLANQFAIEMLTPDAQDPTGKALNAATDVLDVADAFAQALRTGQPMRKQVEVGRRGRKSVLDVHAVPLGQRTAGGGSRPQDSEGHGPIAGLLVAYDITDIIQTASIRTEFAANASHELRTPLAILRGSVEALDRLKPGDTEAHKKFVRMLDRQVRRLEDLTRDLLNLHAIESGKSGLNKQTVALAELGHWVEETFVSRAQAKGLTLRVSVPDPAAALASDPKLLEIILQNLLDNAIKFTASGSIECSLEAGPSGATLRVRDMGCGIPAELQSRVFERFFQVDAGRGGDPAERGTGLGLAIVKHAAERLRGRVELKSQVDKGTTVTVTLPLE